MKHQQYSSKDKLLNAAETHKNILAVENLATDLVLEESDMRASSLRTAVNKQHILISEANSDGNSNDY